MTTTDPPRGSSPAGVGSRRRRPRQAPAARALATGAALSATGLLVAAMGAAPQPDATVNLVSLPSSITAPDPYAPPQTTIVVIHRPASVQAPAALPAAPTAGRAVPAPQSALRVAPVPAATSSAS